MIDLSRLKSVLSRCFAPTRWWRASAIALVCGIVLTLAAPGALAASDRYVIRFLKAFEPVAIPLDAEGNTQMVSPEELSAGKVLFNQNCENCHLGGTTLLSDVEALDLESLHNATPPLDNITNLVGYMRTPLKGDQGEFFKYSCREVSPAWMSDKELQDLSAFILRAAEKVEGWGAGEFGEF